jgi:hypothetical protein
VCAKYNFLQSPPENLLLVNAQSQRTDWLSMSTESSAIWGRLPGVHPKKGLSITSSSSSGSSGTVSKKWTPLEFRPLGHTTIVFGDSRSDSPGAVTQYSVESGGHAVSLLLCFPCWVFGWMAANTYACRSHLHPHCLDRCLDRVQAIRATATGVSFSLPFASPLRFSCEQL